MRCGDGKSIFLLFVAIASGVFGIQQILNACGPFGCPTSSLYDGTVASSFRIPTCDVGFACFATQVLFENATCWTKTDWQYDVGQDVQVVKNHWGSQNCMLVTSAATAGLILGIVLLFVSMGLFVTVFYCLDHGQCKLCCQSLKNAILNCCTRCKKDSNSFSAYDQYSAL
jgi:hypothetical protein